MHAAFKIISFHIQAKENPCKEEVEFQEPAIVL